MPKGDQLRIYKIIVFNFKNESYCPMAIYKPAQNDWAVCGNKKRNQKNLFIFTIMGSKKNHKYYFLFFSFRGPLWAMAYALHYAPRVTVKRHLHYLHADSGMDKIHTT